MLIATAVMLAAMVSAEAVEGPAPISPDVIRVRLAKLGYTSVTSLKLVGNAWEATVSKNGAPLVIHFDASSGGRLD
ncbi:MAG: hypothetical protein ABR975_16735 [Vulcanimicrobiaceae bacterium]|jgi:hypothetical protein